MNQRLCRIARSAVALAIALHFSPLVVAQKLDAIDGSKIYKQNAESVFLLLAKSSTGDFVAQGSGFLIPGQKIATNAHVAKAGKIYLVIGAAKIPTKLTSIDAYNDLALLTVDIELTASPLSLSGQKASPGDTIYAIGNPEGLEKTISQGLVSGLREIDGRELIQLSAPISHGSSGGPVFNSNGEVVGVAVGSLADGQNLNFAIPVMYLRKIMSSENSNPSTNALSTLEEVGRVQQLQGQDTYSADGNSPWQVHQRQINELLKNAIDEAGSDPKILTKVAQVSFGENYELTIEAAQRGINIKNSPELELILAKVLNMEWVFSSDAAEKSKLLAAAEKAARAAIALSKNVSGESYYTLAEILANGETYGDAEKNYKLALTANANPRDGELHTNILRGLVNCATSIKKPLEAEQWFQMLIATGKASAWDWGAEGDRLYDQLKFAEAERAYRKSADTGSDFHKWCLAAVSASFAHDEDSVLSDGRKCIDTGAGKKDSEIALAQAHHEVAEVLNRRGVYSEALAHARESITLNPNEAASYDEMADALFGLRRFEEVVNAAQQAIRLSDGKYAWMHFRLGSAYFELQNWEFARQSFEKAAQLDPKLAPALYNVALCYVKLGYYKDAIKWYEEYLRRNPSTTDRAEVETTIAKLKNF